MFASPGISHLTSPSPGLQLLKAAGREGNLIAIFHEEHSRVLQQLQVFTFFPEALPAARKPFERKTTDRQSARKPLLGMVSSSQQRAVWPLVKGGNLGPDHLGSGPGCEAYFSLSASSLSVGNCVRALVTKYCLVSQSKCPLGLLILRKKSQLYIRVVVYRSLWGKDMASRDTSGL